MKCPIHSARKLIPVKTKYGTRYSCPVNSCTVAYWNGSSSTPANYKTRQARIAAHTAFDKLWRSGVFERKVIYKKLAKYMNLLTEETHIGHFDIEQCQQVIEFCEAVSRQI